METGPARLLLCVSCHVQAHALKAQSCMYALHEWLSGGLSVRLGRLQVSTRPYAPLSSPFFLLLLNTHLVSVSSNPFVSALAVVSCPATRLR